MVTNILKIYSYYYTGSSHRSPLVNGFANLRKFDVSYAVSYDSLLFRIDRLIFTNLSLHVLNIE